MTLPRLEPDFVIDDLSLDWLRAKPGRKWRRFGTPYAAWIADMDFPPSPAIVAAMEKVLAEGDLGYPEWSHDRGGSPAVAAWARRCEVLYGWQVDTSRILELNDVVQGIQIVLHLCTEPGDGVVVHTPAYPPFLTSVEASGRRVVRAPATASPEASSGWTFDHDALDARVEQEGAKVLLLCHPHNPTGHVFSDDELASLADLAERHDLLVISDEIHADLVYAPRAHRPMALFAPERTVTLHAPSKAFNVASLRYAVMHVGAEWVEERIAAMPDHLFGSANLMGATAAEAAWSVGEPWLTAVLSHLDAQRHLLVRLLAEHLPKVGYTPPEATYLAWLDCHDLGWGDDPAAVFAERGVKLSPGPEYGVEGHGFARLNFATSSSVLREMVELMAG